MAKNKQILGGHKKVGTKFIPPMMQLMPINEISYLNQILPEIIWMGLILDKYGYNHGIDLIIDICKKACEINDENKYINFSLASSFNLLSFKKKNELVDYLFSKSSLDAYTEALLPFINLYKNCPLSFLNQKDKKINRGQLVSIMKECLNNYSDKYKTPSLIIQANVIYLRGITGGILFSSEVKPPNLNCLIDSPESNEAKKVAGFVRSSILHEFMPMGQERNTIWAKSFWNQGYKIDECDFSWELNDSHG